MLPPLGQIAQMMLEHIAFNSIHPTCSIYLFWCEFFSLDRGRFNGTRDSGVKIQFSCLSPISGDTSLKPDILIVSPLLPAQMAQLEARYRLHRYDMSDDPDGFLEVVGDRIEAVVTTGGKGLRRGQIERMPNLKIASLASVGYDAIDMEACADHGIHVTNTPGVLTDDVADLAIGLLIATRRNLITGDAYVRSGDWGVKGMFPHTSTIRGKKLGIAGLGRIGIAIAARASVMGMEIAYHNRNKRDDVSYAYMAGLAELAGWADIVVAAMPGGAETNGLFNEAVFDAIGPTGSFINIARGSVVDEQALITALRDGRLGSAGLDVFLNEPNPDPDFFDLPNVVLHPHHASGTIETRSAMCQLVVDNLAAHFAGRSLLTPVD